MTIEISNDKKERPDRSVRIFVPIIVILSLFAGALIARFMMRHNIIQAQQDASATFFNTKSASPALEKLKYVYRLIDYKYVDTVNINDMVEKMIPDMLAQLDPHSVYIPAKELQGVNDELDGSFVGIGVQFALQKDTVAVVQVIPGGPSEQAGLMPGDRIIKVNDSLFVGKSMTNEKVLKNLKGPRGSFVSLDIMRNGTPKLLHYKFERGDIPVSTVDISYMMDQKIGYIKISRFGKNTYDEFITALAKLQNQGMKSIVVDLRSNGGGYLQICVQMLEQLLPRKEMIVYTEGKSSPREAFRSDGEGRFKHLPLAVLVDDWSASASEIFSGAIQDNDRGIIVGRRTFGKGLVQQQMPLEDGSAVRLTIARYHTPSGRCIQKPYTNKDEYGMDAVNRMNHGEFMHADSIKFDKSLKYTTRGGRTVYGGGGIMPDYFVPADTLGISPYFTAIVNPGYIYQFAFQYVDQHRKELKKYKGYEQLTNYLDQQGLLDQMVTFAESKGVKKNSKEIEESRQLIKERIYAYIARNVGDEESFYRILNKDDTVIKKAVEEIYKPILK